MKQRIKLAWAILTGQEKKYTHRFLGKVYIDNGANSISDALFLLTDQTLQRDEDIMKEARSNKTLGLQVSHIIDSDVAPNEKIGLLLGLGALLHQDQQNQLREQIISDLLG